MLDIERYEKIYLKNKFLKTKFTILEHYTNYINGKYHKEILNLPKNLRYLDLASGQAQHSKEIINHFDAIIFSEISNSAISFMQNKFKDKKNVSVKKIDISKFALKEKVEIITMASSLSYIDIDVFLNNIRNNLTPDGYFIFLDTLNSNLIYKIYRNILAFLNPSYRSIQVLKQLLNKESLSIIQSNFEDVKFSFHGNSIIIIFLISKLFPIKIRNNQVIYLIFTIFDRFFSFLPPYKVVGVCKAINLQIS